MCNYFYTKSYCTIKKNKHKNEIGQVIESYIKDKSYKCDIQPIDERLYNYTWGNDIKSNLQMFCNESLQVNDLLVINDKPYKIEKKINWDDYSIYALLESEVIIK